MNFKCGETYCIHTTADRPWMLLKFFVFLFETFFKKLNKIAFFFAKLQLSEKIDRIYISMIYDFNNLNFFVNL